MDINTPILSRLNAAEASLDALDAQLNRLRALADREADWTRLPRLVQAQRFGAVLRRQATEGAR